MNDDDPAPQTRWSSSPDLCPPPPFSRTSMAEQVRAAELEMTAQALRDSLRDREKEMEGTMRELRKQQADRHRW